MTVFVSGGGYATVVTTVSPLADIARAVIHLALSAIGDKTDLFFLAVRAAIVNARKGPL